MVKNLPANAEDVRDVDSVHFWVEKKLEEGMATHPSVFLPGESHGQVHRVAKSQTRLK